MGDNAEIRETDHVGGATGRPRWTGIAVGLGDAMPMPRDGRSGADLGRARGSADAGRAAEARAAELEAQLAQVGGRRVRRPITRTFVARSAMRRSRTRGGPRGRRARADRDEAQRSLSAPDAKIEELRRHARRGGPRARAPTPDEAEALRAQVADLEEARSPGCARSAPRAYAETPDEARDIAEGTAGRKRHEPRRSAMALRAEVEEVADHQPAVTKNIDRLRSEKGVRPQGF